jgi:hypothetical protein
MRAISWERSGLGALTRPNAPQVVVRCRPLNSKEKGDGRQVIVDMNVRQGQVRVRGHGSASSAAQPTEQLLSDGELPALD